MFRRRRAAANCAQRYETFFLRICILRSFIPCPPPPILPFQTIFQKFHSIPFSFLFNFSNRLCSFMRGEHGLGLPAEGQGPPSIMAGSIGAASALATAARCLRMPRWISCWRIAGGRRPQSGPTRSWPGSGRSASRALGTSAPAGAAGRRASLSAAQIKGARTDKVELRVRVSLKARAIVRRKGGALWRTAHHGSRHAHRKARSLSGFRGTPSAVRSAQCGNFKG